MAHDISPPLLALSRSSKNQSSKKVGKKKNHKKMVGISDMTLDVFLHLPKSRCLLVKLE